MRREANRHGGRERAPNKALEATAESAATSSCCGSGALQLYSLRIKK